MATASGGYGIVTSGGNLQLNGGTLASINSGSDLYPGGGLVTWTGNAFVKPGSDAFVSVSTGTLACATSSGSLTLSSSGNFVLNHTGGTINTFVSGGGTAQFNSVGAPYGIALCGQNISPTYSGVINYPVTGATVTFTAGGSNITSGTLTLTGSNAMLSGGTSGTLESGSNLTAAKVISGGSINIGGTVLSGTAAAGATIVDSAGDNLGSVTYVNLTGGTPNGTVNLSGGTLSATCAAGTNPGSNNVLTTAGTWAWGTLSYGGSWNLPNANDYLSGGTYGIAPSPISGTLTLPTGSNVLSGVTYGVSGNGSTGGLCVQPIGSLTGLTSAVSWVMGITGTVPPQGDVLTGTGTYSVGSGTASTSTYTPSLTEPPGGYVYSQGTITTFGVAGTGSTASLTLPSGSNVWSIAGTGTFGVAGTGSMASLIITPSTAVSSGSIAIVAGYIGSGYTIGGVNGSLAPSSTGLISGYSFLGVSGSEVVPSGSDVWTGVLTGLTTGSITFAPSQALTTLTIHGTAGTYNVSNLSISGSDVLSGIRWGPGLAYTGTVTSGTVGGASVTFSDGSTAPNALYLHGGTVDLTSGSVGSLVATTTASQGYWIQNLPGNVGYGTVYGLSGGSAGTLPYYPPSFESMGGQDPKETPAAPPALSTVHCPPSTKPTAAPHAWQRQSPADHRRFWQRLKNQDPWERRR